MEVSFCTNYVLFTIKHLVNLWILLFHWLSRLVVPSCITPVETSDYNRWMMNKGPARDTSFRETIKMGPLGEKHQIWVQTVHIHQNKSDYWFGGGTRKMKGLPFLKTYSMLLSKKLYISLCQYARGKQVLWLLRSWKGVYRFQQQVTRQV